MAINTDNLETVLTDKIAGASETTDNKDLLLLSKSVEALDTVTALKTEDLGITVQEFDADTIKKVDGKYPPLDGSAITGIDAFPPETLNTRQYLRTDGTTKSWENAAKVFGPAEYLGWATDNIMPNASFSAQGILSEGPWVFSLTGAPFEVSITEGGTLSQDTAMSGGVYTFQVCATDGTEYAEFTTQMTLSDDVPAFNNTGTPNLLAPNTSVNFSFTQSIVGSGTAVHTLTSGSLPSGMTLNSDGTITGTSGGEASTQTHTFEVTASKGAYQVTQDYAWSFSIEDVVGQAIYGTAQGTGGFSWACPQGVTSVSVVCIGGGGNGPKSYNSSASGGGGAGLGWINNYETIPGQSYYLWVGRAGNGHSWGSSNLIGQNSYFVNESTVAGYGGGHRSAGNTGGPHANGSTGGGWYGDGGGAGGNTGSSYQAGSGAGGYSGNGSDRNTQGASGGGGGGGGEYSSTYGYSSGGGVGLLGEGGNGYSMISPWSTQGSNYGAGGPGSWNGPESSPSRWYWGMSEGQPNIGQGKRGMYGENPWSSSGEGGNGGLQGGHYGGGGGGQGDGWPGNGGYGGQGGVRIIYGANRSFPANNTNDRS
jgi:hypothetical protein